MENLVTGTIESKKGFYVGDICYALKEEHYYQHWGATLKWKNGVHSVPGTGFSFCVNSTKYGDGTYAGSDGFEYGVDAGVIGIVPLELAEDTLDYEDCGGRVILGAGTASFESCDGVFDIELPDGTQIHISTYLDEDVDDEFEEYWDDGETMEDEEDEDY